MLNSNGSTHCRLVDQEILSIRCFVSSVLRDRSGQIRKNSRVNNGNFLLAVNVPVNIKNHVCKVAENLEVVSVNPITELIEPTQVPLGGLESA